MRDAASDLVLLLAPFTPHLAEELWREVLGGEGSVHRQPWPSYDPDALVAEMVEMAVQVNGKVRDRLEVRSAATEDEIVAAALALPNVVAHTAGRDVRKVLVVPGKLVSIVAA